jgi:GNAT superfamily N-acetyltransferase
MDKLSLGMVILVYGAIVPPVNIHEDGGMLFSWYCQRDETTNMQIRPIDDQDVPAVATILRVLAQEFIVHESTPEGATTFLRENDENAIRGYIALGHVYYVAESDGGIAGFISVRERKHLFHMFVALKWQRQGVGRALWKYARAAAIDAGASGDFTVNSSNFAVPMYAALGFVRTAPMQCLKGLFFNPMALTE